MTQKNSTVSSSSQTDIITVISLEESLKLKNEKIEFLRLENEKMEDLKRENERLLEIIKKHEFSREEFLLAIEELKIEKNSLKEQIDSYIKEIGLLKYQLGEQSQ